LNDQGLRVQDETTYKLLKLIGEELHLSQRAIAKHMGISLGKVNYCLQSLVDKGHVKARNFYSNKNKSAYMYFLTPAGIEEKVKVTYRFLKFKIQEFEEIKQEITRLKSETKSFAADPEQDNPID
jgi:EPS-associated MarR family transcriptional regulator